MCVLCVRSFDSSYARSCPPLSSSVSFFPPLSPLFPPLPRSFPLVPFLYRTPSSMDSAAPPVRRSASTAEGNGPTGSRRGTGRQLRRTAEPSAPPPTPWWSSGTFYTRYFHIHTTISDLKHPCITPITHPVHTQYSTLHTYTSTPITHKMHTPYIYSSSTTT